MTVEELIENLKEFSPTLIISIVGSIRNSDQKILKIERSGHYLNIIFKEEIDDDPDDNYMRSY